MIEPVVFDAARPVSFARSEVVLRMLILCALSVLGGSIGWLYLLLFLLLPIYVALCLSGARTADAFFARRAPAVTRLVRWFIAFFAYLAFLTDALPGAAGADAIQYEIEPGGAPTVGSALGRLITSLPAFVIGALAGFVGAVVSVIAAAFVLVDGTVPGAIYDFQRGVVRWQARLFAYHASLVDVPPPLTFDGTSHGYAHGEAA